MATILPTESTQRAGNGAHKAIDFHSAQRIGDLSRIVDPESADPESAWESIRSGLADDGATRPLTGDLSPGKGAVAAATKVDTPMTVVPTGPSATKVRQFVRWTSDPARGVELRGVVSKVWRSASRAASAGAKGLSNGWNGLQRVVQRQAPVIHRSRLRFKQKWQTVIAPRSRTPRIKTSDGTIEVAPGICGSAWEEGTQLRLESAMETAKSTLALIEGALRPIPTAGSNSPDTPFALQPVPWVLGALSPVISARTMMLHGSHHAQLIETANRLAQDHEGLANKDSLEIVRWACKHARGTELHSTVSEAWNHSFYWQSLTPVRKRPRGELAKALDRMFGSYSNFADSFARAGAAHLGSGWLWLTASRGKRVRILTTSGTDCPAARGVTCLLAVDLWEHAYYLDHPNRLREYLDALIDRRLDWDFAEQRFRLFLERESAVRRKTSVRAGGRKRGRRTKRRKAATARH